MNPHHQKDQKFPQLSPLMVPSIEMFPQGIEGVITVPISACQAGQIKIQGQFWRSRLYELNCQATLLPGQPVLAIGRQSTTLIVIPYHCLLWNQYMNEFWSLLTDADIDAMCTYERQWRQL